MITDVAELIQLLRYGQVLVCDRQGMVQYTKKVATVVINNYYESFFFCAFVCLYCYQASIN